MGSRTTQGLWRGLLLALLGLCLAAPRPASARLRHRISLLGAAGVWAHPEQGGHGVGLLAYDLFGLPRGSVFSAVFNTDMLRVSYHGLKLAGGRVELGVTGAFEVMFAGLLPDYYRLGARIAARGFRAGYAALSASAKLTLPGHSTLELLVGGRRWFFSRQRDTAPGLRLPADQWALEPTLRYTLWKLRQDRAWGERHRLFPRVLGYAIGLTVSMAVRPDGDPWGNIAGAAGPPANPRNDPDRVSVLVRQWLLVGLKVHPRIRTQVAERLGWGHGNDDLYRVRLGGMNPYVVPLAGAPWAAFLSDRYIAARWSWHVNVWRDLEVGPLVDLVWMDDIRRTGESPGGFQTGLGALADWRLGNFQVDLHVGWSPTMDWQASGGQVSLFAALGWQYD